MPRTGKLRLGVGLDTPEVVAEVNRMAEASYARGMRAYHEEDVPNLLKEIGYLRAVSDVSWTPQSEKVRDLAVAARGSLERAAEDLGVDLD